ncbi:hypothetical protein D9613_001582 [Agrocybe pediades]|uniref:BZIP domain-containing protein n=1 Tax=Agrocybe pediades TaxID=84607 RepID=A0A8H4R5S2_9AGAR|nr:hypothetical protein D9613_001582 [Agrocybe pediades]
MDAFPEVTPLWDLSQHPDVNQLPDNDFLALLQKQFPADHNDVLSYMGPFTDGVNPQNLSAYSLPSLTPPSEDSSPSPPNSSNQDHSNEDANDSMLKRKASDEDFSDEPTQKSQHTNAQHQQHSEKRANTGSRRGKAGGNATASRFGKDEGRLLKRKEQNRAAQRAFRERKEKHVKDLEDKVADLEAKNEQALNENENLRDLLTRLQSENVALKQTAALKQSAFTFSVPKSSPVNMDTTSPPQNPIFSTSPPPSSSSISGPASPKMTNPLDWSSLTTFDPSMLNLLDESVPQPTATQGAMQMDFGFGTNTGLASNAPFTTIASNPMFMSFASTFDNLTPPEASGSSPSGSGSNNYGNGGDMNNSMNFNFDMNNLSTWPAPASNQDNILDDLFSGYMTGGNILDNSLISASPSSISPVAHHISPPARSPLNPASSSSSSSLSPPLHTQHQNGMTPRDSPRSDSDSSIHHGSGCPKTKSELGQRIVDSGASPFAPAPPVANLRKSSDSVLGTMIACAGSSFPKTAKSDKNIEVLSAWRTIRADPKFKDADINELCSEFTSKARCDGTKVVLEPQGVNSILESLAKKQ